MTTEQIQCFFKVVELGSFTKAADAMYMTQPALSKRIHALEDELQLLLFTRDKSRQTQLTDAGKVIYDGFSQIHRMGTRIIKQAKDIENGMIGTIRIGIFENQIMDEYLQEILNDFATHYPNVELYVTTDSFNGLVEKVKNGKLDCAVTIQYDLIGRSGIRHRTLYRLKSFLVVPERFLEDRKERKTLKDFADLPFLTITEDGNTFQNRMIREQTRKAGFEPKFIQATDEKNFMMMLEMGKGIAILDNYSKCCGSPSLQCISVPEIAVAPFDLVWTDQNSNPAFRCFEKYLRFEDGESQSLEK